MNVLGMGTPCCHLMQNSGQLRLVILFSNVYMYVCVFEAVIVLLEVLSQHF